MTPKVTSQTEKNGLIFKTVFKYILIYMSEGSFFLIRSHFNYYYYYYYYY